MSMFRGMLLFDIADEPIGMWEENLGGRGYIDIWEIKSKGQRLYIQGYEDCAECEEECTCQEVFVTHEESGYWNMIGVYRDIDEAIRNAKEWMHENPTGW